MDDRFLARFVTLWVGVVLGFFLCFGSAHWWWLWLP